MKEIFIENSHESFADFHDSEWIKDLFQLVEGSFLENEVEDFCSHWWGASRMFTLPWLLTKGVCDIAGLKDPDSLECVWNKYLENNAFKGAAWKTAENSYCSLYYAYENLIVAICCKLSGDKARVTNRDFNKKLIILLGEPTVTKVWTNSNVVLAKEIRNSIVHNGGKVTEKLEKMNFKNISGNGDVFISATDTRKLYISFKPLIRILLERALKNGC
ncbi:hypothetical protein [Shewanella fidelis]|uniref:RiboL-PSP-HEPN domain-containing protein n=1 Tax=Shewanella fidelis TaxID=173509 RepID=A0AAW8NQW5_9GAMM|nr:hypothetical protein [Shewanella fidelis]MDR8525102.1 hypothetical protein [Shewanella fidelis]MDW4811173.1 hypothetical protein [Shewanella fidelis]MDW4815048.1 hypothetical protein [Shewanella fidelis]MDW4819138.1 hypothetical protein [Shewanella fidelis]MDW4823184.1 hypothetical protein [Shewanella fidelis]